MTPHLVKWQNKFVSRGFTVVEINDGRMDSREAVEEHITSDQIPFPVLHDASGKVTRKFGVRMYPTAYLIGRDGQVLWEGHPGNVIDHEALIEQALQP